MGKWTQTVTAKVLGIGALALLMTIPLLQVRELVSERQQLRSDAISQIAQGWGGKQVIGGPVLVVPTLRQMTAEGQATPRWQTGSESVLADTLKQDVAMVVTTRSYGIYSAPVFVATVTLAAQFRANDIAQYRHVSDASWQGGKAELRLRSSRCQCALKPLVSMVCSNGSAAPMKLGSLHGARMDTSVLRASGSICSASVPASFSTICTSIGCSPSVSRSIGTTTVGQWPSRSAEESKRAGWPLTRNSEISCRPRRSPIGNRNSALPPCHDASLAWRY